MRFIWGLKVCENDADIIKWVSLQKQFDLTKGNGRYFEILSYNTRGIGDEAKRKKIFNYIKRNSSGKSIIFLQETHSTKQVENLWRQQWHGDMIFSHGTSNSKGCCIAFRYDLEYKLLSPEISDENGRFIILHIEIQGTPYILINYYGPNSESAQVKVLERIASYLYDMEIDDSVHFVLGGDWDLIFDKTLDFMVESPSLKYSSLKRLQSITIDFNLLDIWRVRNPSFRQLTCRRSNLPKMSRIDFFLISNEMQYNVKFLENKVIMLEKHLVETEFKSETLILEYESAKADLEKINDYVPSGAIFRSKVRWYEEGEKNTSYFLSLEKRNKAKSHIRKIINTNDAEITDEKMILKEISNFYSNLYSKKPRKSEDECLQYLASISTPQLSSTDREACEGKITMQNCWEALMSMKDGKSPGNDGLTKEFFVCFFGEVAPLLIQSLNYSFTVGELSTSQKQAVITLIEKKGRDKRLVQNWRPISLMNVDTKIASKVIALRMKKVLPNIINYDQTAYVKNRYIGESIRVIDDILYHAKQENLDEILFAADMEKTFDSLEHNFIFSTLTKFGFGQEFIQWVRTFLRNGSSCVMNNGVSTGYFNLERGARQGDPLSPYLFILCLETFSFKSEMINLYGVSSSEKLRSS